MVEYNCMCCDFITPLKSNYNRHLKTKKHLKNIRIKDVKLKKEYFEPQLTPNQLKLTPIDPKKPQKSLDSEGCDNYNYGNEKYVCTSCDKYFSSKSHLTRHLKKSCIKITK